MLNYANNAATITITDTKDRLTVEDVVDSCTETVVDSTYDVDVRIDVVVSFTDDVVFDSCTDVVVSFRDAVVFVACPPSSSTHTRIP